ncbi:MAG: SO2930 family diheme c-type cytochrome [Gammaproteobacteria bacterium]
MKLSAQPAGWLLTLAICAWAHADEGMLQAPTGIQASAFTAQPPPQRLSDYNLFTNSAKQHPQAGLIPYDLISPLHSDYSSKFRFLFIPQGHTLTYRAHEVLEFPVGSALIKTFAYPASTPLADSGNSNNRLLETRILVRLKHGWQARVYIWDSEQQEAYYKVAGKTLTIDWLAINGNPDPLRYRVPNLNQCKSCHSKDGSLVPLGPKIQNLDHPFNYRGAGFDATEQNQLQAWARLGILSDLPTEPEHAKTVDWRDANAPLEKRARAYLDSNCAHCHNPTGMASNSGLFLNLEESRSVHLGLYKRTVAAGKGTGGHTFAIVPKKPDQSIIVYRMSTNQPGIFMPEIALARPHAEGISLITDWILSLD